MNLEELNEKKSGLMSWAEDATTNPNLGVEAIEVGDTVTIVDLPEEPTVREIDGVERKWCDVITKGDRGTVSLSTLAGTAKIRKHFAEKVPDWENRDLFVLPRTKREAIVEIATKWIGTTIKCIAIAEVYNATLDTEQKFCLWEIQK